MPDDRLSAALEEIRERGYENGAHGARAARLSDAAAIDVPRLLAALDAVLKPHQPGRIVVFGSVCKRHENYCYFSITSTEAADVQACPDCTATVYVSCAGCGLQVSLDRCPVRNGIARELLGEAK